MLRFERVSFDEVRWAALDSYADRSTFQTREWLEFLVATQGGEAVVARIDDGGDTVGWFTGMIVKRYGVRILGSPFQGWTSGPMGFNLIDGSDRAAAFEGLLRFAFGELRCMHVEMLDRQITYDDAGYLRADVGRSKTFEVDLTRDEDEIFGGMSSACRRAVRKSKKVGVRVERATGEGFAEEYFAQLEDVFAKQELRPPYSVERVRELIRHVEPSGRLLLLRAVDPDGRSIATGVFPVCDGFGYFWGGASWREHQIMRPNEALMWGAMCHMRELGVPLLDLGGGGEYKRKFGVREVQRPFLRQSRVPGLMRLRNLAERVYWRAATHPPGHRPR